MISMQAAVKDNYIACMSVNLTSFKCGEESGAAKLII